MDTRRLLSSTVLYGVANIAVMAVGGFLLLPLYTRTLSQGEFGMYVAIRANIDLLTYLLQFGLPSALGRNYFDYKKKQQQHEYVGSVALMFLVMLAAWAGVLALWGDALWQWLSPSTPAQPYLALSAAIAAASFPSAVAALWLRMEGRVMAVVGLQVGSAALLAVLAVLNLALLRTGLVGLLGALLASSALAAAVLPKLLQGRLRLAWRPQHVKATLHYALPVLVGYIAYFVLNRFSTLVLQHHVSPQELAVYGLALQLSMAVGVAANAFGMALQPRVFAAEQAQAQAVLRHAARLFTLLMLGLTGGLVLFAPELLALVGPPGYAGALPLLVLLLVANFTSTFTLISDTALLYLRRPKTSVAISLAGAAVAALGSLWLVPLLHLEGAALAVAAGLVTRMLLSHWAAAQALDYSAWGSMLGGLGALAALAALMAGLREVALPPGMATALKIFLTALAAGIALARHRYTRSCA
ncbi:lipopolysaccharide biosynthesis protein [Azohydromonas lata]|uniref:Oligosaccharide flippase family protein n=1 Tax=Azohydromonas lata TaxID=45677 RepID=A0ABU5ID96_9BURK|nr:oligosaccharide flippase family protein [Azohydromonas lata]MDZ5456531.1 oligosaccharide flippase family protein [Azohydromonas lata]